MKLSSFGRSAVVWWFLHWLGALEENGSELAAVKFSFPELKISVYKYMESKWGGFKRTYLTALWQANFYLPRQASAAGAYDYAPAARV